MLKDTASTNGVVASEAGLDWGDVAGALKTGGWDRVEPGARIMPPVGGGYPACEQLSGGFPIREDPHTEACAIEPARGPAGALRRPGRS